MAQKHRENRLQSYFRVHSFKAIIIVALGIVTSFCIFTTFNGSFSKLSETQKFFASVGNFRCPQETLFSKEEIAAHASENDLWIVVDNNVLDVSEYKSHPGGAVIFSGAGGDDAAEAFIQFHQPSVVRLFHEPGILQKTMNEKLNHHKARKQSQRHVDQSPPKTLWTNMAKIGYCLPREHHYPTNVDDVVALVKRLKQSGQKCRVAGCGKSPNTMTFTDGHLIHMDHLNRVLNVDKEKKTITCEGGVVMHDMFQHLTDHDLMLRCVPSYVSTTIGGCIGTATHGSGIHTKCLSDYVLRIVLVDGNGEVQTYDTTKPKELSLVACHLGVLGIVVEVTIQAELKRMWKVRSSPVSVETLLHEDTLSQRVNATEFYRFFWFPNTNYCYETVGVYADETDKSPTDREVSRKPQCLRMRLLDAVRKPSVDTYYDWQASRRHIRTRLYEATRGNWLRHKVVEAALAVATVCPEIQPFINRTYRRIFYNEEEVQYGSPLECFTFDCLFKQWACEWAIDASKAVDAFKSLREMIASQKLSVHFPVEFRFTDADATAMSPAYGRKTCWIGIVMYRPYLRDARDTMKFYEGFSRAMTAIGGRPHWAKYYTWGANELKNAYGANWDEFQRLRKSLDPSDMFVNGWWRNFSENGPVVNSTISHL